MTKFKVLHLMHFVHRGSNEPRKLIRVANGFDWSERPEKPPHPGTWLAEGYKGPNYYKFHRREQVPEDIAEFLDSEAAYQNYDRYWPTLSAKLIRRMLRLGWVVEDENGVISVTSLGRSVWYLRRYGYKEGNKPARKSRKRRPQGLQLTYSMYRWHVQGRNYKGSTPQPAPHILLRERERLANESH